MDVHCTDCHEKIGEYTGLVGHKVPIESKNFTRIDGSKPEHGSSTTNSCPHCAARINELEAVIVAMAKTLDSADARPPEPDK